MPRGSDIAQTLDAAGIQLPFGAGAAGGLEPRVVALVAGETGAVQLLKCEQVWENLPRDDEGEFREMVTANTADLRRPDDPEGVPAPLQRDAPLRPSETRLLDLLTTPMPMIEIARRLGVSRQRVHTLVSQLLLRRLVRLSGDRDHGRMVARWNDPVTLLSGDQSRALSALASGGKASLRAIAAATGLDGRAVADALTALAEFGLTEATTHGGKPDFWSLTAQGRRHPQFRAPARKATPVSSGIRSDRRHAVLALLQARGPLRGIAISRTLGIERQTGNALMQYFKRKGWVAKTGDDLFSAYRLTTLGAEALETLHRRRSGEAQEEV